MDLSLPWSYVCDIHPAHLAPLIEWCRAEPNFCWPELSEPTKPQRIFGPTRCSRIIESVLRYFPGAIAHEPMLSRMKPGQSHPLHVDIQRADWITRIHVPIVTNPGAWMLWEDESKPDGVGARVHFEAGKAYTFDTLRRHAFGNDGDTERVHLIFDVLRKDA